jgi:hypothetical protein
MADFVGFDWGAASPQGSGVTATGYPSTVLSGSASTDTKGAWTQIISATTQPASALLVQFGVDGVRANTNWFLDIGIGAAAAEQPLISNLMVTSGTTVPQTFPYLILVEVPKGSRLSARFSCSHGSASGTTIRCGIQIYSPNWETALQSAPVKDYGINLATSEGTTLVPGASAESAWVEVAPSATFAHSYLIIYAGKTDTDTALTDDAFGLDIGLGVAGSETTVLGDLPFAVSVDADNLFPSIVGPLPVPVAKGNRIAIRALGVTAQTGYRFALYGMG